MRKKKRIWLAIVVIIVLVIGFAVIRSCGRQKAAQNSKTPLGETYTVKRGKIVSSLEITGEIQPQVTVQIKSKVSGKIVKFYVDENDFVKTGQIIADIEPDYNQASTLAGIRSRLSAAEIRLKNARITIADKQKLLAGNYATQKDVDAARDELESAELEYSQAQQQYELVKELDTGGKVTHVYATASGTVIQRPVQEGEMIISSNTSYGEGSVILKVADLRKMVVKANINEVDIAKFKVGQAATIKVDALPYEDFAGKITKIAPMASTVNSAIVFPVEISLDNPGTALKPGMTGNVSITGETREDVLVIPIRAVFTDDKNQDIVYLYKSGKADSLAAEAKAVATPVKLGANDLQNVEVIAGLQEGDKISLTEPAGNKFNANMQFQGF
jgi:HlyD family secretion protein